MPSLRLGIVKHVDPNMIPSFVIPKTLNLDDDKIIMSLRLSLTDYRRDADGLRVLYLDYSPIQASSYQCLRYQ